MFFSAYSEKPRVRFECVGSSLTKQSMAKECDINQIMLKAQKGAAITHFNRRNAEYGDATGESFTEAMNLIVDAQKMFSELPSSIRSKFGNDPASFLDFVQDEDNAEEMVELGLAKLREKPDPIEVRQVDGEEPAKPAPDTVVA